MLCAEEQRAVCRHTPGHAHRCRLRLGVKGEEPDGGGGWGRGFCHVSPNSLKKIEEVRSPLKTSGVELRYRWFQSGPRQPLEQDLGEALIG